MWSLRRREYRSKGSCSIYFSGGLSLGVRGTFYYMPLYNKESEVMHGVLQKALTPTCNSEQNSGLDGYTHTYIKLGKAKKVFAKAITT